MGRLSRLRRHERQGNRLSPARIDINTSFPPIRSYVRREGRITRAQAGALRDFWPEYGVDAVTGPLDPVSLFGRDCPVIAEIGFGNGEALVAMAADNPQCDFIGFEVYRPGVGGLLLKLKKQGLTNVRVVMDDAAVYFEGRLVTESLSRVLLFFPDPWQKKKHHKRRLLQPGFVGAVVRCLKPGGQIHVATDWEDYALHISDLLQDDVSFRNLSSEGPFTERPTYRPRTKYENRGTARGHGVWDIIYERI